MITLPQTPKEGTYDESHGDLKEQKEFHSMPISRRLLTENRLSK